MKLTSVFVRFYKSFNYDYIRKIKEGVEKKPWETVKGQFYPYVEVPVDAKITAIVGANESGKSHLLSAVEKGILGYSTAGGVQSAIASRDMCRYSLFFTATRDGLHQPDFGFAWQAEDDADRDAVRKACGLPEDRRFDSFFLFRTGASALTLYIPKGDGAEFDSFTVQTPPSQWLPHVFRIESAIALPDSVSLDMLLAGRQESPEKWPVAERSYAGRLLRAGPKLYKALNHLSAPDQSGHSLLSSEKYNELLGLREEIEPHYEDLRLEEVRRKTSEFNLAFDLIFQIARIEKQSLQLLRDAIEKGDTGIVRTIEDKINTALETHLNFSRVWTQDRDFSLRVKATGYDLDFIISDRTGGHYTFAERSSGLKHFLSYYIQYLVHKSEGRSEILLMDEPDAFLSGEAQQDLLRVFEMFADPIQAPGGVGERVPVQVIYVTHSPFLIDKNHAERVRALEKAEGSKGTRVIAGTSQNRYEPLRSAFGPFVGETTFISRCNLMVEGPADQILLAGAAAYLRKLQDVPESKMLDLNRITIVPAGGGTSVPYMVYLARGRDTEKPAVIVLLDSDTEGENARRDMGKNGSHPENSASIDARFILLLGDIKHGEVAPDTPEPRKSEAAFEVLEDLVPLPLALRATQQFLREVYRMDEAGLNQLTEAKIEAKIKALQTEFATKNKPLKAPIFTALQHLVKEMDSQRAMNLGKVAFARTVIDLLPLLQKEDRQSQNAAQTGLREFETNMKALFTRLHRMQRDAERDVKDKRMRQRIDEKIKTFRDDFPVGSMPARDDGARLLMDIETDLEGDDSEATFVRQEIVKMRASHNLTEDLIEPVRDTEGFFSGLERLQNASSLASREVASVVARKEKPRVLPSIPSAGTETNAQEEGTPIEGSAADMLLQNYPALVVANHKSKASKNG
jgi:predicted ATPase